MTYTHCSLHLIFTRERSYCFQRDLAIAILSVRLSVRLSIRLSVTRVDQSKTVFCDFWPISRCISVTVRDKA